MNTTDHHNITKNELIAQIEKHPTRSAWRRGVKSYALDILDNVDIDNITSSNIGNALLNGADDWQQYSQGGGTLIYDADIAARLCSPSELLKVRGGERQPNGRETWLDVQARACTQASMLIIRTVKRIERSKYL